MVSRTFKTASESQTEALGAQLAPFVPALKLIYLRGDLGVGKTTFVRGLLRGLGHAGAVKSPTFTLVEPYTFAWGAFYHFDLYRLTAPQEIEMLGFRDYLVGDGVCVIEWPERAAGVLPSPDLNVMMQADNKSGRTVQLQAHSPAGEAAMSGLR